MAIAKRMSISLPQDVAEQLRELRKTDEYIDRSWNDLLLDMIADGLKIQQGRKEKPETRA